MVATKPARMRVQRRGWATPVNLLLVLLITGLGMTGCAQYPIRQATPQHVIVPTPPPVSTQVIFYPNKGQNAEQQDRDRYECYLWAMEQTGFDPSVPHLAPHHRVEIVPEPAPGHDTAVGTAAGAVLGAVLSPRGKTVEGAVVGAVAGAVIGSASDAARAQQSRQLQSQYDRQTADQIANLELQASNYRRAMAACLEGRGYTVR